MTHGFVGCAVNIVDNPDHTAGLYRLQQPERVHERVDTPLGTFTEW